ncbi:MAG: hypothetical protein A2534_03915 [Candidatus Magasanikbacteria bacterium RIFOXYD2_FULL_39_9]|uniref:Uncharacterized protein n=1 Tax=Candidatus Magasanikbacteria bacterium RIFOXYD1_FULL_40_23 TaxID=1798705 RepID=A0A1F6P8N9_9BACT|nr:MAG: hypothetical protein A2563_02520 [Candidatus Magasanikbacteria bacterium RIFOXYD1_FULL_40_23]OGH93496.1 MAG: hypothetical protein A2534_03915 [Candidatus Magasanikbacteria bacterium RIFOXYD2_FULL_39_9]
MSDQNHHDHCANCNEHKASTASASPLDSLKNEITAKLNDPSKKSLPWNNVMITAVLAVLTLVSLSQMAASVAIFTKLKTGSVQAASGAPQNSSLEALPDMVGGC